MRQNIARFIFGLVNTYVFYTICYIVVGIATPGDAYGNGMAWVPFSFILAVGGGFLVGFVRTSKRARIAIVLGAICALLFDVFVPEGWWAKPPPMPVKPLPSATAPKP